MMIPTIQTLVFLLSVIAAVLVVAARTKIPAAILLVLAGVALALVPGLPVVELAPEFVLLIVLPPLIYSSAVAMSWREFCSNLEPITSLALGCVIFTTIATAAASHWLLGFPWPVGFVLGALVSPPDPVAPLAIARRLRLPRRILVILEGEGLANDATALVLYRFAVAAVGAGVFSLGHAAVTFGVIVVAEIIWGLCVGWLMLRLRRWVRDPSVEMLLSILTPYLAFWPPQQLGGSGVLATVAVGLYISWNGLRLISSATRLQGVFFWAFFIYVIEGMVFLLTGLQVRSLIAGISAYSTSELMLSAAIVIVVVIIARFAWVFLAAYLPHWLMSAYARKDPAPTWQVPFVLAFTGIRGIVSLAAALAIPLTIGNGEPFPHRPLIIFLTFCVILATLVGQGLTLPRVIRRLGLANAGVLERDADRIEEFAARRRAVEEAIRRLERLAAERNLPDEILQPLREFHRQRIDNVDDRNDGDDLRKKRIDLGDEIQFLLIDAERKVVNQLYCEGYLKDEARRRIEHELDLRDAHLASLRYED
jgi:monovalent cation/hydrogen antiporter